MDRREFLTRTAGLLSALPFAKLVSPSALLAAEKTKTMRKRAIPGTDEKLPVVGVGTWQQFDPPEVSDEQLKPLGQVLRELHKLGGRVVDTSPMYGDAERVVGRLTSELDKDDSFFLATKVWTRGQDAGEAQMQRSLEKLQRQTLDLIQVHNLVDWQRHLETLRKWKEQGKVRYIGITHYRTEALDELTRIIRNEDVDFVQCAYSVLTREPEQNVLPAAKETKTAVLINRPFEGGRLFRMMGETPVPEEFHAFADSWAKAWLKFIIAHPAVTTVIPGTSDPAHMREDALAGIGPLPDEAQREALAKYMAERA